MNDKTLKDKAMKIKGKDYVQVKDRILFLAEHFDAKYSIETSYDYFPERKMWVVKATLTIDGQTYTGLAQELESSTGVNQTSALENAETSAVGRACAMAGIGVIDSIASTDEITKAENRVKTPVQQSSSEYFYNTGISKKNGKPWWNKKHKTTGEITWLTEQEYAEQANGGRLPEFDPKEGEMMEALASEKSRSEEFEEWANSEQA